jgi:autotransporter passenger strand-loop-strand repeat protein
MTRFYALSNLRNETGLSTKPSPVGIKKLPKGKSRIATAVGTWADSEALTSCFTSGCVGLEFHPHLPVKTGLDTKVNAGGIVNVNDGGASIGTKLNDHGIENVNNGGQTNSATINAGSIQNVDAGAKSSGSTVNDHGIENVSGDSEGTDIHAGGVLNVGVGGSSSHSGVGKGGVENVSGSADSTFLDGGTQHVLSGGTATNTAIGTGSLQIVDNGGTSVSPEFQETSSMITVSAGGNVEDVTFDIGGTLKMDNPSQLSGTITLQQSGQSIIDFTHTVVTSFKYKSEPASLLTVTYGDNNTAEYVVAANQRTVHLVVQPHLQPDGSGGTELVLTTVIGEASIVGTAPNDLHSV